MNNIQRNPINNRCNKWRLTRAKGEIISGITKEMRGIGARNKAVAQHRLGYFQQFHQPKNCRCSVVRTYVQRDRLYKYALTPIPREICNELAAPVQGGSSTRSISQRSDLRFFLSPPYVVGHPCCWKTSLRMKITIRLSLTNS